MSNDLIQSDFQLDCVSLSDLKEAKPLVRLPYRSSQHTTTVWVIAEGNILDWIELGDSGMPPLDKKWDKELGLAPNNHCAYIVQLKNLIECLVAHHSDGKLFLSRGLLFLQKVG